MENRFDAFLSYDRRDQREVEVLAKFLRDRGLVIFLDLWYLVAGQSWPESLERELASCNAVIVCIGRGKMGNWQQRETYAALERQNLEKGFPVIPVLLPGAEEPGLTFLLQNTWVDLKSGIVQQQKLDILEAAIRRESIGPVLYSREGKAEVDICPYKGLAYFREEDAPFFFGRTSATENLLEIFNKRDLVAVLGPSGSGKSSVVRAGLVPRLRQDIEAPWEIVILRPKDRPIYNLSAAFIPLLIPNEAPDRHLKAIGEFEADLKQGILHLRDVCEQVLTKLTGTERLVLIVDQWEELYTLSPENDANRFIDELLVAAKVKALKVVFTLRADFMDRVLSHRELADQLQDSVILVGPMSKGELKLAIEEPAKRLGIGFEPGLVERILEHVGNAAGRLPLLEFVLQDLWNDPFRQGGPMLNSTYTKMGELEGALSKKAEDVYSNLKINEQEALPRIFLKLVKTGTAEKATRRQTHLTELDAMGYAIIQSLTNARLLVTGGNINTPDDTVEVAHESLINHWPRLCNWVETDREFLLWRERLQNWREQWSANKEDKAWLLRDAPMAEARRWLEQRGMDLDRGDREFIELCLQCNNRREKKRLYLTIAAGIFVIAIAFWLTSLLRDWFAKQPYYEESNWVNIKAGEFAMGWPDNTSGGFIEETPIHMVRITKNFKISKYEVTFEEFDRFARDTDRRPPGDTGFGNLLDEKNRKKLPVINVSWEDAKDYALWLSKKMGKRFRLPTEAEWEYSARAGTKEPRYWDKLRGDTCTYANVYDEVAATDPKSGGYKIEDNPHPCVDGYAYTSPVGKFKPNQWGLYDMMGNVFEWVQDCTHCVDNGKNCDTYQSKATVIYDIVEPENDCSLHIYRGGSWASGPPEIRSAYRGWNASNHRDHDKGFRLVEELESPHFHTLNLDRIYLNLVTAFQDFFN